MVGVKGVRGGETKGVKELGCMGVKGRSGRGQGVVGTRVG